MSSYIACRVPGIPEFASRYQPQVLSARELEKLLWIATEKLVAGGL